MTASEVDHHQHHDGMQESGSKTSAKGSDEGTLLQVPSPPSKEDGRKEVLVVDLDDVKSTDTTAVGSDDEALLLLSPTSSTTSSMGCLAAAAEDDDDSGSAGEKSLSGPPGVFHVGVPGVTGYSGHDSFGNIADRFGNQRSRKPSRRNNTKQSFQEAGIVIEGDDNAKEVVLDDQLGESQGNVSFLGPLLSEVDSDNRMSKNKLDGPYNDSFATTCSMMQPRCRSSSFRDSSTGGSDMEDTSTTTTDPQPKRRASIGCGGEVKVWLPGRDEPIRRRRSIKFDKNVLVCPVDSIQDLTDEPETLWFQAEEYDEIRQHAYETIDQVSCSANGGEDEGEPRDHNATSSSEEETCIRGLEALLASERICQEKYSSWDIVLDEQDLQKEHGLYDEDYLADIYREQTHNSLQDAIQRASKDEQEIQEYQSPTRVVCRGLSL